MDRRMEVQIGEIAAEITADYAKGRVIDRTTRFGRPDPAAVREILVKLNSIVYAGYETDPRADFRQLSSRIRTLTEDLAGLLFHQLVQVLSREEKPAGPDADRIQETAEEYTLHFLQQVPAIRGLLNKDIEALYLGDPAAESKEAIVLSYPGLYAITVQRFAHVLYTDGIPILPRMMTEHAHSVTGIDINPGAQIGEYFFIDHGTGVVIGETTQIGSHVKIYQGVTLGALSTREERGLVGRKRHPTIQDHVTIYSGASILGGETVIGEGSVIGGNVFLTRSVPPGSRVYAVDRELSFGGTPYELEYYI